MCVFVCVSACMRVCVSGTCGLEDARIALAVPGCKRLHHTINLLGFARKSEAPQKLPTTAETERDNGVTDHTQIYLTVCGYSMEM